MACIILYADTDYEDLQVKPCNSDTEKLESSHFFKTQTNTSKHNTKDKFRNNHEVFHVKE